MTAQGSTGSVRFTLSLYRRFARLIAEARGRYLQADGSVEPVPAGGADEQLTLARFLR